MVQVIVGNIQNSIPHAFLYTKPVLLPRGDVYQSKSSVSSMAICVHCKSEYTNSQRLLVFADRSYRCLILQINTPTQTTTWRVLYCFPTAH